MVRVAGGVAEAGEVAEMWKYVHLLVLWCTLVVAVSAATEAGVVKLMLVCQATIRWGQPVVVQVPEESRRVAARCLGCQSGCQRIVKGCVSVLEDGVV